MRVVGIAAAVLLTGCAMTVTEMASSKPKFKADTTKTMAQYENCLKAAWIDSQANVQVLDIPEGKRIVALFGTAPIPLHLVDVTDQAGGAQITYFEDPTVFIKRYENDVRNCL